MKLFDGLHPYEILLEVLGVLLFLVALLALIRNVMKEKPFGSLLPFIGVAVVMIGYPSIKSIEISNDTVKIEKLTQALQQEPTNASVRQELQTAVQTIASRPVNSATRATTIARAQFVLGNDAAAEATVATALRLDPNATGAVSLQKNIQAIANLQNLLAQVEKNPSPAVKTELEAAIANAKPAATSPTALLTVAKAQAAIGEYDSALKTADTASKANPKSAEATAFKKSISDRVVMATPPP